MINMPRVGVLTFEHSGRLVAVNDAFLDMVGYSREEFGARPFFWYDFTPREYVEESLRQLEKLFSTGRLGPYEKEYFRKDGSRLWLMVVAADFGDGNLVKYAIDISDRKRAEAALAAELEDAIRLQEVSSRLSRDGGTDDLYERLVDAAIALMRADTGSMQRLDADQQQLRLLAWRGFAPESAAHWSVVSAASGSSCGAALERGERVIVPDVETCDFMAGTDDLAEYRRSGLRASQTTPLIARDGRLVGMLSTHWRTPHEPAERELRLFDVLVRQAADLIERHESERSLRESEEQYRTLFDSIDEGFCTIEMIFGEDERPIDYRFLNVNPAFVRQTGLDDAVGRRVRELVPLHEQAWFDILGQVAMTGGAVRFEQRADQLRRFYDVYAFRVGAPHERRLGILFNDIAERKRLEAERERLVVAEAVAAERQALLKRVVRAQEEERRRLSHEVHDSATQLAHAASLRLDDLADRLATTLTPEDLRDLEQARDLARSAAVEARRLIAGLRPETLDQFGLVGALRAELDALRRDGWRVRFVDTNMTGVRIGEEKEIILYRVAQEAIANVRKHAGPTSVEVRLRRDDGHLRLSVHDRGRGFDPSASRDRADLSRQLGLVGMRERVELLGGGFVLRSAPGKGTRIEAVVPIVPPDDSSTGNG
jgi:PAS domain S-box-containing protein